MRPTERTTSALADNQARVSRPVVFAPCDPRGPQPVGRLCPGDSPSRDIRVGCVPSPSGSSQPGGRTWVSGLKVASVSPEPPGQPGRYTGRRFSDWLPRGLWGVRKVRARLGQILAFLGLWARPPDTRDRRLPGDGWTARGAPVLLSREPAAGGRAALT